MVESLTSFLSHWTWCSLRQAPFCFIYFFSLSGARQVLNKSIKCIHWYLGTMSRLYCCLDVTKWAGLKQSLKYHLGWPDLFPHPSVPTMVRTHPSAAMPRTGEPTFLLVLPLLFHISSPPAPLPSPFSFLSFFKSVQQYASLNLIYEMLTHFCCSCYGLHGIINCLGLPEMEELTRAFNAKVSTFQANHRGCLP